MSTYVKFIGNRIETHDLEHIVEFDLENRRSRIVYSKTPRTSNQFKWVELRDDIETIDDVIKLNNARFDVHIMTDDEIFLEWI
jgi:hypothetical protein